jgi:hypothetical protein
MGTTNFHCLHLAFPSVEASIHVTIFVAKPINFLFFLHSKQETTSKHTQERCHGQKNMMTSNFCFDMIEVDLMEKQHQ